MKIGVLGSGIVGQTVGGNLASQGHDVVMGTRRPDNLDEKRGMGGTLRDWLDGPGAGVRITTFDEAAAHGEVVINATAGTISLDALAQAADHIRGKILIDISNPLDFSGGFPPSLSVCNTDSVAEQIQRAHPETRVVKTLNTVTAAIMVAPDAVADGDHAIFVSGDDPAARAQVTTWLREWFGWRDVIDLGDLSTARGTEMILPLWVRIMSALGTPMFNFKIAR